MISPESIGGENASITLLDARTAQAVDNVAVVAQRTSQVVYEGDRAANSMGV